MIRKHQYEIRTESCAKRIQPPRSPVNCPIILALNRSDHKSALTLSSSMSNSWRTRKLEVLINLSVGYRLVNLKSEIDLQNFAPLSVWDFVLTWGRR
jgi:hypothetical protein